MRTSTTLLIILAFLASFAYGEGWPHWRGANMNDTTNTKIFAEGQPHTFQVAWKKSLGSGYSSVSVADGYAVTMFTDGESDLVVAMDAQNGQERWRQPLAEMYAGHDGSHDGPISTPAIANGQVFALGPKGHLVALQLATGKVLWKNDLVEQHAAKVPFYGVATSPVVFGEVVLVEIAIADTAISGFDRNTGKLLWSAGKDAVNYQSPIIAKLADKTVVVCGSDNFLYGLDPITGKKLFEYEHKGRSQSINPLVVGDNKIFFIYKSQESMLLEISVDNDRWSLNEVWKSRHIKNTFNPSVYHDGHLYGYSGRFFSCIDAEKGQKMWKSRQPGDGFCILVDGHLVITTKKGELSLAKADAQGFQELANLALFQDLTWTPASFANGRIYVRSLGEIAAVDIVAGEQTLTAQKDTTTATIASQFAEFIAKLEAAEDKNEVIGEFVKEQKQFPIVEGDDLAHFVFQGEADNVGLVGDLTGFRMEQPLTRVAGTDFFYFSTKLAPDAHIHYRFIKDLDYDQAIVDPNNPRKAQTFFGEFSWMTMPQWQEPKHLEEPGTDVQRGKIEKIDLESKIYGTPRHLEVYLPAGYGEASGQKYPTLYFHWGNMAQDQGKMVNTLDNTIGRSVAPVIVIFIHDKAGRFSREKDKYTKTLVEEIVPAIDRRYHTDPQKRAHMGVSAGGFIALYATWKHPGVFSHVASQSAFLLIELERELQALLENASGSKAQLYLEWGQYDLRSPLEGWDVRQSNRQMASFLDKKGYSYKGGEVADGHNWDSWRSRTDQILQSFFPLQNE